MRRPCELVCLVFLASLLKVPSIITRKLPIPDRKRKLINPQTKLPFHISVQYSTVQYSTLQYSTQYITKLPFHISVQYTSTVQFTSTVQYSTLVQYSTVHSTLHINK